MTTISYESLFAERRITAFVAHLPHDVNVRRGRRGGIKVLERTRTNDGEEFVVAGSSGNYTVTIGERVECSCPDECDICKHISYIYLDVLKLAPTNPLTWQTSLLPDDLKSIFPSLPSKKRVLSPPPALSTKRARPSPPVDTSGLTDSTVRLLLLFSLQTHPEAISHVEKMRLTPLDGLTPGQNREVLATIGGEYEDVEMLVKKKMGVNNDVVENFKKEIAEAEIAMSSLDRVSSRWQFERSGEVSDGVSDAVHSITKRVNPHSSSGTRCAAIQALISIGESLIEMGGEIGKCIRQSGTYEEVGSAISSIIDGMGNEPVNKVIIEGIQGLHASWNAYSIDCLQDVVEMLGDVEED